MSHLVDTTEMYLKAVYELEEEGVAPLRARLVERLGQSKPTVSETVARLERDGLMRVENNRLITLTKEGKRQATVVMRKHRLAERLLLDVLGLEWAEVHEEACRWEHVMSDAVEKRLESLLTNTEVDPYGNPIPDCSGVESTAAENDGVVTLATKVAEKAEGHYELARIAEVLQTDPNLLRSFCALKIVPGARLVLSVNDGVVTIDAGAGPFELNEWHLSHLFVR